MKCPICNNEARIDHSELVENQGQTRTKYFYKCRTKGCANYNKIFKTGYGEPRHIVHDPDMPVGPEAE